LNTESLDQQVTDSGEISSCLLHNSYSNKKEPTAKPPLRVEADYRLFMLPAQVQHAALRLRDSEVVSGLMGDPAWKRLSPWSRSTAKRLFDCGCVFVTLPVLVPLMLGIAAAVRLTSRGPVLFLQERMGRHGKPFTILKFRTMIHVVNSAHRPITTLDNQRFTLIGPFLRRWKLDELPQLINVLLGHMSLVGPRPKMREHVVFDLPCRPGITGMATNIFACEETILSRVPAKRLDAFYHAVILPAKRQLDAEYMSQATFFSDLQLIVKSVFRRWDSSALDGIILASINFEKEILQSKAPDMHKTIADRPIPAGVVQTASVEQVSAF